MDAQKLIKSLCCSYGWSYGILWGFHHTNSILLTFKEAYYEQHSMGGLIDNMLLQAHVLGGGIIGEAALMKNHRWVYLPSDDSEFFYQFSMGIKTIAVISVEPWGVVQLGSTHKIPEIRGFVDQVKQLFRQMDSDEAYSDSHFLDHNSLLPPSDYHSSNFISPIEDLFQIESNNVFDIDCSLLTPSWPRLAPGLDESKPMDHGILDEFFHGSNFGISKQGLEGDLSHYLSPHASGLIDNLPTNSLQSSASNAFVSSLEECILEKRIGSTSKSLFSELGLDQLLDGMASTSHSPLAHPGFEDRYESRAKRRKTENLSWSNRLEGLPSFDREMESYVNSKESHPCIGERCREARGEEEEGKCKKKKKKKGKAGSRTRPKDRQMIQDRLAELRELVPNGYKMSIDRLLERTIGHLNFMQSLTKHAQTLKQIYETKNINVERGESSNGGVTWACEVGDQEMVCPLLVEDLSTPGQMLIEIVCEEQGLFLEIVDVIRGFGLIVRKGVMEVDERRKIRGEFVVEADVNRRVSRHEIFSSLIQLLQVNTDSFGASASLPINLPEAFQCVNQ